MATFNFLWHRGFHCFCRIYFFSLQIEGSILGFVSDANATASPILLKYLFEKRKKNLEIKS